MSDLQTKIFNVIAITVAAVFFCFASSWILFEFKGSSNSLKDTWSIVSSLFGGGATLVAAYIASLLFSDWRDPANYTTTKEQALEVMGVLSQVKYKLNTMQDNLRTLNKINAFLIFNEELLVYEKEDIHRKIYEVVKNIRFIDNNLFKEFALIHHHYIHSETFFILIIKEYKKYYNYFDEPQISLKRDIEVFPPISYCRYGLDPNNISIANSLKRVLDRSVGFSIESNNSCEEVFTFKDLPTMIIETIEKIDKFEEKLIEKLKATN
ncbi:MULTISPECIES: hypothetical protein [unclassified Acinetobacter]|uniref:hypothetical protein n=1 Tax=unclassified Acinetobacter TaxID=196816 RepID=UPI0015D1DBA7|nr:MULTISPECIES: hypothetical protein [unclassified Acinetobacter]